MDLRKIGQYIAIKRKNLGLTQVELAEKLGMSNKSVSKWERGVCLPDVSVYMELCNILGISLNEFIAGEDIEADRIAEKSEENIVDVTKNEVLKRKKLKKIILALSLMVAVAVGALGYYLYPTLFPRTNYLEPFPDDSKEIEIAEEIFGVGTAYLYNYSIDETYSKMQINLSLYKEGQVVYEKTVVEFPVLEEGEDGYFAIYYDYLDDEAKIRTSVGTIEFPMFEELEKMISSSSSGRVTSVDVTHGQKIGLACFMYDENILRGYSVEDIEAGTLPTENNYTYYLTVTFL